MSLWSMLGTAHPPQLAVEETSGSWRSMSGFGRPFGLSVDDTGSIYVADMDVHGLCRVAPELDGAAWLIDPSDGWRRPARPRRGIRRRAGKREAGFFSGPHAIAFDNPVRLYVAAYHRPSVHVLSTTGGYLHDVGGRGSAHPLSGPATTCFTRDRRVLVSEYRQNAVLAYDPDDTYRGGLGMAADGMPSEFGQPELFIASDLPGGFDRPHMCREAPDGTLHVVDTWNHRLQRFTADGRWLGWLGASAGGAVQGGWRTDPVPAEPGEAPGAFQAPVAISFASDGDFVVTDWGNARLQRFTADGHFAGFIDTGPQTRPHDAQFLGRWFAVADSHNGRVLLCDSDEVMHAA
jgi:sugar lactone lactonase YvrE